ncbi:oxygenase MpaB family protein [Actinocorallia longicatena]|uniref:ER-bound oxygenase mpaB/mpaB'/Rubber oxygenase catalytic domain-containing protein n=1 Tax=Actinocorallia longicatena TaxID=111803 RepID=A0ABP6Q6X5_9ACTN
MRPGLFDDSTAIRDIGSEPFAILGGGPALLLQFAHPKVALGVAEHSGFRSSPFPRLFSTLDYLSMVVFGSKEEAHRVAWSAMRAHDVVQGPTYSAHDPDLLLWVQATLFQLSRELYERVFGELAPERAEEYYQQSVTLAELLGAPREALPADSRAFAAYWAGMVETLEVGDVAREQARAVMFPPTLRWLLYPAMLVFRLVTTGLLPEPIRRQYGFPWSPRRELVFRYLLWNVRLVMNLTPRPLRKLPAKLGVPLARRLRWNRYQRPVRPARQVPAGEGEKAG